MGVGEPADKPDSVLTRVSGDHLSGADVAADLDAAYLALGGTT